jgi:chloramphenicol 3-O phosphotransferase
MTNNAGTLFTFIAGFLHVYSTVLPLRGEIDGPFSWAEIKPALIMGFFNCLSGMARAGNNIVADYIIESEGQFLKLKAALTHLDVFFVGVHCPLPTLNAREKMRGDRRIGDAEKDFAIVHTFSEYDFEVDSSASAEDNAQQIMAAWTATNDEGVLR